jgi:hypothetical protein
LGVASILTMKITFFLAALFASIGLPAVAGDPPRIFYLCDNCNQYQMAYTEDVLTQTAKKDGIGVIKLGDGSSEYSDYHKYVKTHPGSGAGGLTPLKPVKLDFNTSTYPKDDKEAAERRKQFAAAKKVWASQILEQFKKLDHTKPLVLHFGNHGINPDSKDPKNSSSLCMYTSISSISQCLTYGEIGDLLTEAGLTGPKAPPIRIIGDHCFGGGVHSLSMKFPNICSASNVSFKTPQWSPESEYGSESSINVFGQTFWKTALQVGAHNTSLASSFESAWATVPKADNPGGTLSSIFYAQSIMKWDENALPTHNRLPALESMERSLNDAQALYANTHVAMENHQTYGDFQKPNYVCSREGIATVPQATDLEALLKTLTLDSGANIYREAVAKLKNPTFEANGKKSLDALNGCWAAAKTRYDAVDPQVKEFIDKNGNWAWKNFFTSSETVNSRNSQLIRSKDEELANQVLKTLETCVNRKQPAARDYLGVIQTVDMLRHLAGFANAASPTQMANFRKKVECESSPLL